MWKILKVLKVLKNLAAQKKCIYFLCFHIGTGESLEFLNHYLVDNKEIKEIIEGITIDGLPRWQ